MQGIEEFTTILFIVAFVKIDHRLGCFRDLRVDVVGDFNYRPASFPALGDPFVESKMRRSDITNQDLTELLQ